MRASAAAIALTFKNFNAKIARFSSAKLRSFGAKNARSTQGTRAESKIMPRAVCGMRLRLLRSFCRRWARVVRRKCVEIHRNLRDFERKW